MYGDSSKTYTVALLVPNPRHLAELAARVGVDGNFDTLCQNATMEKAVVRELADHARKCEFFFPFLIIGLVEFMRLVPYPWHLAEVAAE